MNTFFERLENFSEKDTRVRAVLRRSLAFEPGEYPPAFPYVEPFLSDQLGPWNRKMYYLMAGLWASHWREGRTGAPMKIGKACALYQSRGGGSKSTESRFIALLDADDKQLPHRLRRMVSLLKEQPLDFEALLKDTLWWNDDHKSTQMSWARDYYRNLEKEMAAQQIPESEEKSR
jgi:CRISPR system Cascade subunit CasB